MCESRVILEDEIVHQKVELPEIKPIVTEYRLQRGRCRICKKNTANLSEGVARDLLRFNSKTSINSFSGSFINSKREVQQILSNSFIRKNGFNKEQIPVTCVWKY